MWMRICEAFSGYSDGHHVLLPRGLMVATIEVGQHWLSNEDGTSVVVEGRSDLLIGWWKVRCPETFACRSIDEDSLRTMYRPAGAVDPFARTPEGTAA